jgi:cell division protein FtsL
VPYVSRRLLDAETRYVFVEKLCSIVIVVTMLALSLGIISFQVLALWHVNMMLLSMCC